MPAYDSFIIVALIAFAAPVLRALAPWLLVPSIVLEILLGVLIGPHALDWAQVDAPVQVFADVGLAMLLFMAGLEIDLGRLRGRNLTLARGGLRGGPLAAILDTLEETTAQIRVRADFALVAVAVWLAWTLGLEAILAAFTAGVIRGLWRDRQAPYVPSRLEGASFGIFIPV